MCNDEVLFSDLTSVERCDRSSVDACSVISHFLTITYRMGFNTAAAHHRCLWCCQRKSKNQAREPVGTLAVPVRLRNSPRSNRSNSIHWAWGAAAPDLLRAEEKSRSLSEEREETERWGVMTQLKQSCENAAGRKLNVEARSSFIWIMYEAGKRSGMSKHMWRWKRWPVGLRGTSGREKKHEWKTKRNLFCCVRQL